MNDTWHKAWNSIPPEEPRSLAAFLGRITRNLALNRLQKQNRLKRGGGALAISGTTGNANAENDSLTIILIDSKDKLEYWIGTNEHRGRS